MCESREKIFGRFNLSQIDKQLDGFCDIMKDQLIPTMREKDREIQNEKEREIQINY